MKGVHYVVDDKGEAQAVVIDLRRHGGLWEDFQDAMVSRARRQEPRESFAAVKARLRRRGLIK